MTTRYPIKWFNEKMQGAPQLYAGSTESQKPDGRELTTLLKSVLVTGFGLLSADSLTYDSTTGLATCTISSGHSYLKHSIVVVDGADDSKFNGEQRVVSVTATEFTYRPATAPADGAVTGVISVKVAPLGWQVLAENAEGDMVIFGSTDPEAFSGGVLVDNRPGSPRQRSGCSFAHVNLVDDVVSISEYSIRTETTNWPASGFGSNILNTLGRTGWDFVGDSRMFFYMPSYGLRGLQAIYWFGDIISYRPGDIYGNVLSHGIVKADSWTHTLYNGESYDFGNNSLKSGTRMAINRGHNQLNVTASYTVEHITPYIGMGYGVDGVNPADNQVYIQKNNLLIKEEGGVIRGEMPGLKPFLTTHWSFADAIYEDLTEPGSITMVVGIQTRSTRSNKVDEYKSNTGLLAFSLDKPWR